MTQLSNTRVSKIDVVGLAILRITFRVSPLSYGDCVVFTWHFLRKLSAVSIKRVEVVLFIEVRLLMEYMHLSAELSAEPR